MPALPSPPSGQLVFASDRSGTMAVYSVDRPGGPAQLRSPADGAAWFPGPSRGPVLALLRSVSGPGDHHEEQLYVAGWDDGLRAVGAPARAVRNPAWSTDGKRVAFESSVVGFRDIWTADRGGAVAQRTAWRGGCYEPQFARGEAALRVVCSGTDPELHRVSLDSPTPVAAPPRWIERVGEDLRPTPGGPDGRWAFYGAVGGRLAVWTVQADGLGAGPAWTPPEGAHLVPDQAPAWAPDAHTLAVVVRDGDGAPSVWLLRFPTSGGPPVATAAPLPGAVRGQASETPTWLPDGTLLATVEAGGDADVWRIDVDSGAHEVWVEGPGTDWLPRWWEPAGG